MAERKSSWRTAVAVMLFTYAASGLVSIPSCDLGSIIKPIVAPVPDDVRNDHGVGHIAWHVPSGAKPSSIQQVASVYRESIQFLNGDHPSGKVKAIDWDDPDRDGDPEFSIPAWQDKQVPTLMGWDDWKKKIDQALNTKAKDSQFGRDDWVSAFDEIAASLERRSQ